MARTTVHGNLTSDPEVTYHKVKGQDRTLAKFSVAESTGYYQDGSFVEGEPNYFDCVAWGREAEHIAASCSKGTRVLVEATLKQNRWEQEVNGEMQKRSRIELTVENIGPSLQFAEVGQIVKTNGPKAETTTSSQNTEGF